MAIKKMTIEEMRKTASKTDWAKVDILSDKDLHRAITEDADSFELPDEEFRKMRPAAEVVPEIVAAFNTRGIQKSPTKDRITIRLDHGVVDFFKGTGKGWQTKINGVLQEYVSQHSSS